MYKPGFLGIFINPFYIARRKLYVRINDNKSLIKGNVLDYGCGTSPYKGLFSDTNYTGADIKTDNNSKENIIQISNYKVEITDNTFDSVICTEVLEHVPDVYEVFSEIKRVLKPNGILLLTTPFVWPVHAHPYDYRRFTLEGLIKEVEDCKYRIIKSEKTGNYPETIAQLKVFRLFLKFKTQNIFWNSFLSCLLSPITIIGLLFGIMTRNKSLYINNFIIAINDKK